MQGLIVGGLSALKYIRASRLGELAFGEYTRVYGARSLDTADLIERGRFLCREDGPLHTYFPSMRERRRCDSTFAHVWTGPLPESQLRPIDKDLYICEAPLAFVQAAKYLDLIDLALVAYELTGTYAIRHWDDERNVSLNSPEVSMEELRSFAQVCLEHRMPGAEKAMRALDMVLPNSNSAAESALALQLVARGRVGGLALRGLRLNEPISLSEEAAKLQGRAELTPDGRFSDTKIGYEYESDERHLSSQDKARDSRRSVSFELTGYKIYQLSKGQVMDPGYLWDFAEQLRRETKGRKHALHWEKYLDLHYRLQIVREDPLCS